MVEVRPTEISSAIKEHITHHDSHVHTLLIMIPTSTTLLARTAMGPTASLGPNIYLLLQSYGASQSASP